MLTGTRTWFLAFKSWPHRQVYVSRFVRKPRLRSDSNSCRVLELSLIDQSPSLQPARNMVTHSPSSSNDSLPCKVKVNILRYWDFHGTCQKTSRNHKTVIRRHSFCLSNATEILSEGKVSEAGGKLIKAIEQCGELTLSESLIFK